MHTIFCIFAFLRIVISLLSRSFSIPAPLGSRSFYRETGVLAIHKRRRRSYLSWRPRAREFRCSNKLLRILYVRVFIFHTHEAYYWTTNPHAHTHDAHAHMHHTHTTHTPSPLPRVFVLNIYGARFRSRSDGGATANIKVARNRTCVYLHAVRSVSEPYAFVTFRRKITSRRADD